VKKITKKIVANPLAKLFDTQMTTLKIRGCPPYIIDIFIKQKNKVITEAKKIKMVTVTFHSFPSFLEQKLILMN